MTIVRRLGLAGLLAVSALTGFAHTARANTGTETPFVASIRLGTLGIGPELELHNKQSHFGVRADFDTFNFGIDNIYTAKVNVTAYDETQHIHTPLDANYKTMNGSLYGDYYPWKTGFRVTSGLTFNRNVLSGSGSSRDGAVFGSHAYSASDLGTMKATVRQGLVNPYLGVGFSTEILPHLTFSGDAGMLFTGAVHSSLNWSGSSTLPASFAAEYNSKIGSVRSDFRSKTHSFEYYPVVMLGLGYRF